MKHIFLLFALLFFFAGCEDMFVEIIDIDTADFPPKLAVTAILDTDKGLTLSIKEGYSLNYYKTYQPVNNTIVRNGTVRLFENDKEIFSKTGTFDLSPATESYSENFSNLPAFSGYTYRIEIEIEGYDKATATAVMPNAPDISEFALDLKHRIQKKNIIRINSLNSYSNFHTDVSCFPLTLTIADGSDQSDFYSLQMEYQEKHEYYFYGDYNAHYIEENTSIFPVNIATPNPTLIQDNPDVESADMISEGEGSELYSFDLMMLTDVTFANAKTKLDLYAVYSPPYDRTDYYPKPVVQYKPYVHGDQEHVIRKYDLSVTHLTEETFRHYRNMAFQSAGIGFFTEPVFITSNMENAYGCFSVQNTMRVTLDAFEGYAYSGTVTADDFYEKPEK